MKYRIVQSVEGQLVRSETTDLLAWAEVRGIAITGACNRKGVREQLHGQPTLDGYCGPMWDGDAVRYEDVRAYATLSA